ncbi:MAG: tetratricopeptide repeat protein [Bacillota bacterium]
MSEGYPKRNYAKMVGRLFILLTLVLGCFVVVVLAINLFAQPKTEFDKLMTEGKKSFQTNTLDNAIVSWEKAAKLQPTNPEVIYSLAMAYDTAGRYDEAEVNYNILLKLNPSLVLPRYNLALICLQKGKKEEAVKNLEVTLKRAPYFTAAHLLLGRILEGEKNLDKAIAEYQTVLIIGDKSTFDLADVHYRLGDIYAGMGLREKAMKEWEITLDIKPGHKEAQAGIKGLK